MHCLPPSSLSVLPYAHESFACLRAYDIHPRRQPLPRRNAQGDSAWIVLLSRRVWKSPASGISSPLHSEGIRQMHRHLLAFYGSPLFAPRYAQSRYAPSHYKAGAVSIGSPIRIIAITISVTYQLHFSYIVLQGRPPLPPRGVACLHYRSVPKCRAFGKKIWS